MQLMIDGIISSRAETVTYPEVRIITTTLDSSSLTAVISGDNGSDKDVHQGNEG